MVGRNIFDKTEIRIRKKLNKNMNRKPEYIKVLLSHFIVIMLVCTFIMSGLAYGRRYLFRMWLWQEITKEGDYSYQDYLQGIVEKANKFAFKSDKRLKKYYGIENLTDEQREKLFINVLKENTATPFSNYDSNCLQLKEFYSSEDDELFNQDLNSLLFSIIYENDDSYNHLTYEFKDEYVSKKIDEIRKKINKSNGTVSVDFRVEGVYIKDDFTFLAEKIVAEVMDFDREKTYDIIIEPQIPAKEDLKKKGYTYVDFNDDKDTLIYTNYLTCIPKVADTTLLSKVTNIRIEHSYIVTENKNTRNKAYLFSKITDNNYLSMPARDGNCIWLFKAKTSGPAGLESWDAAGLLTNLEVLLLDGAIVYLLGIILTHLLTVNTYQKKKAAYEINVYRRELTNVMAHDIKTPLMVLRGNAENLNDVVNSEDFEKDPDIREKSKKYAGNIIKNVDYMNELVNKTLMLSSLETGTDTLEIQELSVNELITEAKASSEELLKLRGIDLKVEGEDRTIQADEFWMKEVFRNLIDNAAKYADENTSLEIKIEKNKIIFSNAAKNLTAKDVKLLSDPFSKKDKSRGGRSGSGLGLTIVKNIIQMHGRVMKIGLVENKIQIELIM